MVGAECPKRKNDGQIVLIIFIKILRMNSSVSQVDGGGDIDLSPPIGITMAPTKNITQSISQVTKEDDISVACSKFMVAMCL